MNVVSFGGGTNSAAMIIGMYLHEIYVDLITFADTGVEQPHTYEFIEIFEEWLEKHGLPKITPVYYTDKAGNRLTLEEGCLRSGALPSIAYGFSTRPKRMKKAEILELWEKHPDLFQRAVDIEHTAAPTLIKVKGLGRNWSWESYIAEVQRQREFEAARITFDDLFPEPPDGCICGASCGCYDG